jgi:serine protease AprX
VGVCALILQANPGLTPAQVKEVLMRTAVNLNEEPNSQGAGRADVYAAVKAEPGEQPPPPAEERPGCLGQLVRPFRRRK